MQSIATKEFTAKFVSETSFSNTDLGTQSATLELFKVSKNHYQVEMILDDGNAQLMGIWVDDEMVMEDYDGCFSLPIEVIEFLEENKFNCEYAKDDDIYNDKFELSEELKYDAYVFAEALKQSQQ